MADAPELVLTSQVPVGGRESHDHYPTPRWCTEALITAGWRRCPPGGDVVLDPSCGEGAILDVYRERGARTLGVELDPTRAAEAQKRGHRVDFGNALSLAWPDAYAIVGNPPYTLAAEFARKAAEWTEGGARRHAALLLRLSFLEPASGRGDLFRRYPPDVLILPRRPAFDGRGTDSITSAWCCWPGAGRLVWLP